MIEHNPDHISVEIWNLVAQLIPQSRSEAWRAFTGARHAVDRSELESVAYLGLMQAANRWPEYCAKNKFDAGCGRWPCERPETCGTRYFGAYATRRMRGAILDFQRAADWVPRAVRQNAKALRDAGEDAGLTEAELASRAGMDVETVRRTRYAISQRPVSMDDEDRGDVAARTDTESQAAASAILQQVVTAMRRLPVPTQVILAMAYFEGAELKDCSVALGLPLPEISRLHADGVVAVREAMVQAAREAM